MDVAELARDIAELRAANAELGAKVSKQEEEREQYRKLYQQMLEKAKKLERGLLGQKAERHPPSDAQLSLQLLAGLLGERDAALDEESDGEGSGAQPKPKPKLGSVSFDWNQVSHFRGRLAERRGAGARNDPADHRPAGDGAGSLARGRALRAERARALPHRGRT